MPPGISPSTSASLRAVARRIARIKQVVPCSPALSCTISNAPSIATPTSSYATASVGSFKLPDDYVPPTQPPSARAPEKRKSQLLRTYTSLLRSTPLILLFQHNNLTSGEWVAVRRELTVKLREVPQGPNDPYDYSDYVKIQVLTTKMFSYALKLVEFYDPNVPRKQGEKWTHDLSKTALNSLKQTPINEETTYSQLAPLLIGPTAALTIPVVSPAHLAAALSILSPSKAFPSPTRRKRPAFFEPDVQSGLSKLLLVGGRIEGKVMDQEGINWVGGIDGGLDSLRAQLVYVLQSAGMGIKTTLETPGKSLWLAMESRRSVLDEKASGGKEE